MDHTETGAAGPVGLNGGDGLFFGDPGGDGGVGADVTFYFDTLNVPTPDPAVTVTLTGGLGGSGGDGGDHGWSLDGGGGNGGLGAFGGQVLAAVNDIAYVTAGPEAVLRLATGIGGRGGDGGDGGGDTGVQGGAGSNGGGGGAADAAIQDTRTRDGGGGGDAITLTSGATGGRGGDGGAGGPGTVQDGPDADGGNGGDANAHVLRNVIASGDGDDNLSLGAFATGGRGGDALDGAGLGEGGEALAEVRDNRINAGAGQDIITFSASAIGGATGAAGTLQGGAADGNLAVSGNVIDGGDGDDMITVVLQSSSAVLVSPSGNTIIGGLGHDVLSFDGSDALSFDMRGGQVREIEAVIGGSGADVFFGSRHGDSIDAALGDDTVHGGIGDDTVQGGYLGTDVLEGNRGVDTVSYSATNGAVVIDLAAGTATGSATDSLHGFENAEGGGDADQIGGDAGDNLLRGLAGGDTLSGLGGSDTLVGGLGADVLDGGARGDVFVFEAVADSASGAGDTITGWGGRDVIDLSGIDADSRTAGDDLFTFANAPPSGDLETGVLYVLFTGTSTIIQADTTGDGVSDLEITVDGDKHLFAGDFVL